MDELLIYLVINAILTLFNFIMVWKLIFVLDKLINNSEEKE